MSKSEITTGDIFIELQVPDFNLAINFYQKLGFEVKRQEDGPRGYLVMQKGSSVLNFYSGSEEVYKQSYFKQFPRDTPRGYAVEVVILVDDIESYYQVLSQKIDSIVDPLQTRPWGIRDFRITDPFGFYLRISERYNLLKAN